MIKLFKGKSKIHGKGIFTNEEISKGNVFYTVPLKKTYDKPKKRCAYIGKGKWVCDEKVLNWINHSCNPNSALQINPISLKATKNIKKGEEITVNYTLTEKGNHKIKCRCGNKDCKGYFKIKK